MGREIQLHFYDLVGFVRNCLFGQTSAKLFKRGNERFLGWGAFFWCRCHRLRSSLELESVRERSMLLYHPVRVSDEISMGIISLLIPILLDDKFYHFPIGLL